MNYSDELKTKLFEIIIKESKNKMNFRNPGIDFSRNRKLTFDETAKIILSMGGNTINTEILEHFDFDVKRPTTSAFVQSRDKILPCAFMNIFNSFNKLLRFEKRFKGSRLIAVDGSNINLYKNTFDSQTHVKSKNRAGHNAMHLSSTYDVLNSAFLDAVVQPINSKDERGALISMVSSLPGNSILIADRGYESYNIFAHIEQNKSKYLVRVKDINSNGILSGFNLPNKEFDTEITVNISNFQRSELRKLDNYRFSPSIARFDFSNANNPVYELTFRVTRILLKNGKYEAIISNLSSEYTPDDIEKIYFLRWGIETSFRQLKYAAGLANLHTKKNDSVMQEIYAKMIMYNFCEAITKAVDPSRANKKYSYKINLAMTIKVCRKFLRSQTTVDFDVEALIYKFLSPVRHDRAYERPLRSKGFTSFNYRVA